MSNSAALRRYARNYFKTMGQNAFDERGERLVSRLLGYDDEAQARGQVFLAPSLKRALEAVVR